MGKHIYIKLACLKMKGSLILRYIGRGLNSKHSLSPRPLPFNSHRLYSETNHYRVLGISSKSTQDEIKEAYLFMTKEYHPDTMYFQRWTPGYSGQTTHTVRHIHMRHFQRILLAYETIGDSDKRKEYDERRSKSWVTGGTRGALVGESPGRRRKGRAGNGRMTGTR